MNIKIKSDPPNNSYKLENTKQYQNFIQFRKKQLLKMAHQNEQQPYLSLDEIRKISPLITTNRVITSQRKIKNNREIKIYNKQQIKLKIKDRIKGQIEKLIKRNNLDWKKYEKPLQTSKQMHKSQNVSVVGSSVIFNKPMSYSLNEKQKQRNKSRIIRRNKIMGQIGFTSRKIKSSIDQRPRISQKQMKIKEQIDVNQYKSQVKKIMPFDYRRSMSTDIKIKLKMRRKPSQIQFLRKIQKHKQQFLEPWAFAVDQQNF